MDKDDVILSLISDRCIDVDLENGEIYSYQIRGHKGEKIKLNGSISNGYKLHTLCYKGKKVYVRAHRVIWMAKYGKIPDGLVIDHINRNKTDNRLCNLRAVTPKENHLNQETPNGEKHQWARLSDEKIMEIRKFSENSNASYGEIARKFNISKSHAHKIAKGKTRIKEVEL